jgi:hypothetical protein
MPSKANVIDGIESQYPKMTKRFKQIQQEQYDLFCHKQHDYGSLNISVGTRLENEDEVKLSLTGIWFRMNDKIMRAKNLLMRSDAPAVQGEPLEDAFLDLSNYGIMATLVKEGVWGK